MSLELELGRALSEQNLEQGARILGQIEYSPRRGESVTLAVLETYVPNAGTAWHHALADVGRYYERVLSTYKSEPPWLQPPLGSGPATTENFPAGLRDLMGSFLESMVTLGHRTAELHRKLLALTGPAYAPEPYPALARRAEYQSLRNLSGAVLRQLKDHLPRLERGAATDAAFVLARSSAVVRRFDPLLSDRGLAIRMRAHGDFHLEQVLFTGKDFVIVDFEGEHDRSFNERRRKRSPLRDVACMVRSIDNAALVALWEPGTVREIDREALSPWASLWSALLPEPPAQLTSLLEAFATERALRDLREELEWRAGGTIIPLRALARMLESGGPRTAKETQP
jgi:maltose alpha-D-glucosyltransferase/alpha-amylase